MKPLVAVFKTASAWKPAYGLLNGGNICAVMQWKDISFIAMGIKIEDDAFSTADVLEHLGKSIY